MLLVLAGTLQMMADDYAYLTFTKADGSAQSLDALGLKITFSDGRAVVESGEETASFTLTELATMFFSNEKSTTGIAELTGEGGAETLAVYSASGVFVGRFTDRRALPAQLQRGVYIMKSDSGTEKIAVK